MKNVLNPSHICSFCGNSAPGADIMIQSVDKGTCICQACVSDAVALVAKELRVRRTRFNQKLNLKGVNQ